MKDVKVQQVIICTKERRGSGNSNYSPIRVIKEVFDFDGNLIADNDSFYITPENVVEFMAYHFREINHEQVSSAVNKYFIEGVTN